MTKLEKIDKELSKAREKAAEWQDQNPGFGETASGRRKQHDCSGCSFSETDARRTG